MIVRVAYHLYYGWNVLPIAVWAFVSVLLYMRVRRLMPFIICHAVWDIGVSLRVFYPHAYTVLWVLGVVVAALMTLIWARWTPQHQTTINRTPAEGVPQGD